MKKLMKRIGAVLMAVAMMAALGVTGAWAVDADPFAAATTVSVTVKGVKAGDTLHLYKIATPELDGSNVKSLNWTNPEIEAGLKDQQDKFLASEGFNFATDAPLQAAIAKLIADEKIDVSGDGTPKATATGTSVSVDAAPGYYVALVKNGADNNLVVYQNMLIDVTPVADTATGKYKSHDAVEADVKSTPEKLTKKQKTTPDATTYTAETADGYKQGDIIPFEIETAVPSYPTNSKVAEFEISDTPNGLTILKDNTNAVTVTVGGSPVVAGDNTYSVEVTDGNLKITFVKSYILAHPGAAVVVNYNARLDGLGVTVDETNNKASIKYNRNPNEQQYNEPDTEIKQKTYSFTLLKHGEEETDTLAGAEFTLWDAATNGNKIEVIKDGDVYRPVKDNETGTNIVVDSNGEATVVGLAKATYWLQEEVAPAGYSKRTERSEAKANEDTSPVGIDHKIPNTPMSQLPTTGGIGTYVFTVAGVAIMAIAAGLLIVRHKKKAE